MRTRLFFFLAVFLAACTNDKKEIVQPNDGNGSLYPDEVAAIITNKCAVEGCHNTQSASTSAGIDFSSWDAAFTTGINGTSVIPYSTMYSYILYFTNPGVSPDIDLEPSMPYNQPPLSVEEYNTLKNWIANGAPDKNGFVKFSDNPARKKFYVCMQGCNEVAVFDAETKVIMRYVHVNNTNTPGPHQVRISPDGKYWAVVFINGNVIEFYNTTDDKLAKQIALPSNAQWNTMVFTPDSKTAYVFATDLGTVVPIDLTTWSIKPITSLSHPHGSYITKNGNTLYVTAQAGNYIHKIDISNGQFTADKVSLNGLLPTDVGGTPGTSLDPHEIIFTPDESKYFVSCQFSNEVRVMRTSDDALLAVIPVGPKPQEFAISTTHPYLFVTCTEDPDPTFIGKGSVYLINYLTNQKIQFPASSRFPAGEAYRTDLFQPHGIALDEEKGIVYVSSLNFDPNGPAPHHVTGCGGKDGFITAINMHTLKPLTNTTGDREYNYHTEVLPYPYYIAYRK